MNIDPNLNVSSNQVAQQLQSTTGSQGAQAATNNAQAGQTEQAVDGDNAQISSQAQQASMLSSANVPDVRQDRVQALQTSIQQGTYQVSNQQIAQSMVNDMQSGRAGIR